MYENAHNHQLILGNFLSGSDILPDMSWFLPNPDLIGCTSKSIQTIHLLIRASASDPSLEIIIPLYSSIKLFRHFYKKMPLHPLLHQIDYRYSHQLCRESPDPVLGCYPTMSFTSKVLWVFPWYIIPSVNCIICFDSDTLLLNSYLLLGWWLYRFVKMPRWVELMPSIIRVNPRVLTSLTLLVLPQINPLHYNFFEKRVVNERLCIEEVGVDLEPLRSCPWTRCGTYHWSFL